MEQPVGWESWRQRLEELERGQREQREELQKMREEHAKEVAGIRKEFEMQEESQRKLKRLEESLLEQEKSVKELGKEMDALKAENDELNWTIAKSREMFGKQFIQFERVIRMTRKLQGEEKGLLGTFEKEKKALCKINRENVRKEELVRKLKEKLARRQNRVAIPIPTRQERAVEPAEPAEGKDPLEIFPEEIWEMIVRKVTDPRDLWNCFNSCSLFRRLLHQWSTTWTFEKALPYLFPYLPGNKLLECRLVSTGWKEKTDQFLQNHPSLRPHDEEACDPRTLPFVIPQEEKELCANGQLVFDGEMLPHLENPEYLNEVRAKLSVWREVNISVVSIEIGEGGDREDEANEQVWEAVYTFFRTFGELVWYFNFSVVFTDASDLVDRKICKFLKEDLIELAPNLRRLRVERVPTLGWSTMAVDWTVPYPNLETLELHEEYHYDDLYHLMPFVRMHHDQLKKLSIEGGAWRNLPQLGWPSLTELHLCCDSYETPSMNSLESLLNAAVPNLSKLVLDTCEVYFARSNSCRFFEILGQLTRTTRLTTLRLVMTVMGRNNVLLEWEPFLNPLYEPPRVTTLELEFRNERTLPYPSFQFLLYFPLLENLHVFWSKSRPTEEEGRTALLPMDRFNQIREADYFACELKMHASVMRQLEVVEVNKFMYLGEMYKSNIWELLPRLKVFSFQWDVYTRGEYEEHRRKRGDREAD